MALHNQLAAVLALLAEFPHPFAQLEYRQKCLLHGFVIDKDFRVHVMTDHLFGFPAIEPFGALIPVEYTVRQIPDDDRILRLVEQ